MHMHPTPPRLPASGRPAEGGGAIPAGGVSISGGDLRQRRQQRWLADESKDVGQAPKERALKYRPQATHSTVPPFGPAGRRGKVAFGTVGGPQCPASSPPLPHSPTPPPPPLGAGLSRGFRPGRQEDAQEFCLCLLEAAGPPHPPSTLPTPQSQHRGLYRRRRVSITRWLYSSPLLFAVPPPSPPERGGPRGRRATTPSCGPSAGVPR